MITDILPWVLSVLFCLKFVLFNKLYKCWYADILWANVVGTEERNYALQLSLESASAIGKKYTLDFTI
ncbi:hypothetical protein [Tychonema sp. LEGE 07203]|uniref:hypothetical protein n=1 Tax=Tychonema sp. LEGE 07203 TaxID=1828671 RepID=UPI00187E471B|nr:hypothetical protein [Tychonema sp. LEGE 07203]MBE9096267.1 hypothetical protein [Tychonema sp. LEGE 07203]